MADFTIPQATKAAKSFLGNREAAMAAGAVRYIDGRPCGRQHIPTIRLVSNTQCVACRDLKLAELKVIRHQPDMSGFISGMFINEKPVFQGSRSKARTANAFYYVNPRRPCPKGHDLSIRFLSNSNCYVCDKMWRESNYEACLLQRRQFWADNCERLTATQRARYAENPEPYKANAKKWAQENPERKKETDTLWRIANAIWLAEYYDAWRRANPDRAAAKSHKRRALKLGSLEHFSAEDIQEIFVQQRGRCAYCRIKLLTVEARDHIVALAKGGSNSRRNIQITCMSCNSKKGARDPIEFAREEFGYLL